MDHRREGSASRPTDFATVFSPSRDDVVSPDARSLRGLAHPLRLQLLGLLRVDGPATATQLAVRTGQSSGSTSYHLRQLAVYGFVIEDAERTTGKRDRYWRAAHRTTMFNPPGDADEETRALGEEYLRIVADANARHVQAAIASLATIEEDLGQGWRDGFNISHLALRLTLDEAAALIAELEAVAVRYRRDDPDTRDAAPAQSQRVVLQFQVLPAPSPALPVSAGRESEDQGRD
ncbi:MAG TPA: helix-turn-helix domain-containing protein [Candidatus Limnocylindrales bacterium]